MAEKIVFHIDVNSAFLSWTAAYRCKVLGEAFDLREVPSVIAGQKDSRRSIVLAGKEIWHQNRRASWYGKGKMPQSAGGGAGL